MVGDAHHICFRDIEQRQLYMYCNGAKPVIYDKTESAKAYLTKDQWWRIVNLDHSIDSKIIDWTHEREWRVPDDFRFELKEVVVILENRKNYKKFIKECRKIVGTIDILTEIGGIVTLGPVFQ